tara:strand:+ start:1294 stop:1635 length:342 start_codon:yes stop_codon:yes gene_type:complete
MNENRHNRRHKTNMERIYDCMVASAKIVGANLRKDPLTARTEDTHRVSWRVGHDLPPLQEFDLDRYKSDKHSVWIDMHTRKTSGMPLSKWSEEEKETIRKFLEAIDDVGTLAY